MLLNDSNPRFMPLPSMTLTCTELIRVTMRTMTSVLSGLSVRVMLFSIKRKKSRKEHSLNANTALDSYSDHLSILIYFTTKSILLYLYLSVHIFKALCYMPQKGHIKLTFWRCNLRLQAKMNTRQNFPPPAMVLLSCLHPL